MSKMRTIAAFVSLCSVVGARLTVGEGGIYSGVTISIQEQNQPEDCSSFIRRLENVVEETSRGLHRLTGSGGFESVKVIFPSSWRMDLCGVRVNQAPQPIAGPPHDADFSIGSQGFRALSGSPSGPWAEQHGGCGVEGLRVHVPINFFKDSPRFDAKMKGRSLLREWCKYRYGVFPESGLADGGDRLYPHLYQEGNATLVNAGCDRKEEDVQASESPFCPLGELYNRRAPTKQNLLCAETSALESILNHVDFKHNVSSSLRIENEISLVKFEYVSSAVSGKHYTIVLDRSAGSMSANGRWRNVHRAVRRFLRWHVPSGARVSLITFGAKEAHLDLPPTVVTDINREGLAGRIPRRVLRSNSKSGSNTKEDEEEESCVYCALNRALQAKGGGTGGSIILITGSPKRPPLLEQLLLRIDNSSNKVFPVAYPLSAHSDLFSLARFGGKRYSVPESNAKAALTEVFLDILRQSEGLVIQKVHESETKTTREFSGTFTLEEAMLHRLTVTLNVEDEEEVEYFEVTDPSGRKHLFSKFDDGMVVFEHPKGLTAETGIWSYQARLYPGGTPAEMSVDVVSQSVGADFEPFMLDIFTNSDGQEDGFVDAFDKPVILYARLTRGEEAPVLRAGLKATVYRPGVQGPVEVILRDDGTGDPDVTAGDGIYSAYFTEFARVPGFYSVHVSADHNQGVALTAGTDKAAASAEEEPENGQSCCGSQISHTDLIPSAPFWRLAAGSSFFVRQGLPDGVDVAPPGRILDLHVARVVPDSMFVHLAWTAPGGDYDRGQAARYEIRCYTTRDAFASLSAFSETGILVHKSFTPQPQPFGLEETSTVGVPWPNEVFFYGIVAFDEAGNPSPISNVISLYIHEASTTTSTSAPSVVALDESSEFGGFFGGSLQVDDPQTRLRIYIAGAIGGVILLLLLLLGLAVGRRIRNKRRQSQVKKTYDASSSDAYKAYEPKNNLNTWLDSLPRSVIVDKAHHCNGSPNTTAHDLSADHHNNTLGSRTGQTRSSTLTKTNPYRHKVLTNGSFLNLKDIPCGASSQSSQSSSSNGDDTSSRPTTTSTNSGSVDQEHVVTVRRSQTHLSSSSPPRTVLPLRTDFLIDTYNGSLYPSLRRGGSLRPQQQEPSTYPHAIPDPIFIDHISLAGGGNRSRTESVV